MGRISSLVLVMPGNRDSLWCALAGTLQGFLVSALGRLSAGAYLANPPARYCGGDVAGERGDRAAGIR